MESTEVVATGQSLLSTQRAREIIVTPTSELTLSTLGTLTVETRNCTAGADPVLHAFSNGVQVAVDDNAAGGVNARVTVSPTTILSTSYVFVVRAVSDAASGQCDLYRNGAFSARVDVGGTRLTFDDVAAREQIEAVLRPNGAGPSLRLYRLAGASIAARAVSGGTAGGALYSVPSALTNATFLVAGSTRGGVVRVVANDALRADADGDGVGDALEASIGTCPNATATVFGFACAGITTPADTDGDGLTDAWELLGRRDGTPQLPLPLWGADPRHKDLFVEVDVAPATVNGPIELPVQSELRAAAARWEDTLVPLSSADSQARGAALRNPDGLPGVRAHFDVGVAPTDPADATLYGNWGGATVLSYGTDYKTAWRDNMAASRRGVFHWAMGVLGVMGQTDGFPSIYTLHSGPVLAHELGHTTGLMHWGLNQQPVNCVPNYTSLMNYLYQNTEGFSDGGAGLSMNNIALQEWGFLAGSARRDRYAGLYESIMRLYVDRSTWSVDWNRDGVIAPAGQTVRAYANNAPSRECEGTTTGRYRVTNASSALSPASVRLGGSTYVFYSVLGVVKFNRSDTAFACTHYGDPVCGAWGAVRPGPDFTAHQGVDIADVSTSTYRYALVVGVDASGVVWASRMRRDAAGTELFEAPVQVATGAVGEPAVSADGAGSAFLAWRGLDGLLHQAQYSIFAGFTAPTLALTAAGAPIPIRASASPGLGRGYLAAASSITSTYGAFATSNNVLGLYRVDALTHRWTDTGLFTELVPVRARPALAWVTASSGDTSGGRLHLVFRGDNDSLYLAQSYIDTRTQPDGTITRTPRVGLTTAFNNLSMKVRGADLLFDPGVDGNLRAFVTHGDAWDTQVIFYPLADGIVDRTYSDFDDWRWIGTNLCRSVANPGQLVTTPVPCL